MDLERVIAALAPRDVVGRAPLDVADLAYDTRAVTPGALFFCVRGANVDGHELAPQAVTAGAAALVVEHPLEAAVPQIVVADSRAAMAVAADVFFGHPTHELDGIDLKLRGRFNVSNALGALAAARLLGIDHEAAARGLEAVRGVPGRFESVDEGQPFDVIVDYSHTPDSLENALRAARDLAPGRVLCVFGCGGDRDREKRPLMGRIAAELADVPILTTDNPRSEDPLAIIDEVRRGTPGELEVEPDRRAAIARAIEAAREGDVVLVAGRGAEPAQEVQGRMLPFDDRDVAREALRRIQAAA